VRIRVMTDLGLTQFELETIIKELEARIRSLRQGRGGSGGRGAGGPGGPGGG